MNSDSQSSNKRIAKNTFVLYMRMILLMAVGLFTSRINLQALGVEDYGIYNVVAGFVVLFSIITGSLSVSISREITFEIGHSSNDVNSLRRLFSSAINIQIIFSVIVIFLAEIIGIWFINNKMTIAPERITAAIIVLQFSVLTFVLHLISIPYNACIIAHEKMSVFAYISLYDAFAKLSVAYIVLVTHFDKLILYAFLHFCITLSLRIIYGAYCGKKFVECKYIICFDRTFIKRIGKFAGWTMLGNGAWVAYTQGVNMLLNMFFGPSVNAARAISVQANEKISGLCSNFQMALNPQIIKSYSIGNITRVNELVCASSRYSFYLLFIIVLPVFLYTENILELWLGEFPNHSVWFLRLLLITILIDSMSNAFMVAAQATGDIKKYQITVGLLQLMILPLSWLSLYLGAVPESVFVVHISICIVAFATRLLFMRRMIKMSIRRYVKSVLKRVSLVFTTSVVLCTCFKNFVTHSFFIGLFFCLVILLLFVYTFGLNNAEQKFIINNIKKIINK